MKNFRKNIKLKNQPVGFKQRQKILDGIDNQGTFLPRGVDYEDIDTSFLEFANDILKLEVDGKTVPVVFLTLLKWSEFSKTWQHADEYKNIKMPFITVVRLPNPQVGTNQGGLFNIPSRRTYVYYKVPTWDGNRKGLDIYKIPQPTSVDFTYEVRLFTDKMRDLNQFNKQIQILFQSRQHYENINGHPMPIHLESIGDESKISDIDKRRYYVQPFEMLLKGYVLDEDEYEVNPTINRSLLLTDIENGTVKKTSSKVVYDVIYQSNASNTFTITPEFDIKLYKITNEINSSSISITVNNNPVTLPFNVNAGDVIELTVTRDDTKVASFSLHGVKQ